MIEDKKNEKERENRQNVINQNSPEILTIQFIHQHF